mgnify:CR=1 FL=1
MALKRKKSIKTELPSADINITSLMDILTTMLFFLILFISFADFSVLKGMALTMGTPTESEKKPTFTMKITVSQNNSAQLWIGPTKGLRIVDEGNFNKAMRGFSGSPTTGFKRTFRGANSKVWIKDLQKVLIEVKKAFPHELKAVLALEDDVQYQLMIDSMRAVRMLGDEIPAFQLKDWVGKTETTKVLFPQVIISEAGREG